MGAQLNTYGPDNGFAAVDDFDYFFIFFFSEMFCYLYLITKFNNKACMGCQDHRSATQNTEIKSENKQAGKASLCNAVKTMMNFLTNNFRILSKKSLDFMVSKNNTFFTLTFDMSCGHIKKQ